MKAKEEKPISARTLTDIKRKHFDEVVSLRKERNEAYDKIRTLTWQLANCGIVVAKSLDDEPRHRTDGDNAATGLESGKVLNMDDVVNYAKHADANLLGNVIEENGKRVVYVMSRGFSKSCTAVGVPEPESPAYFDGCEDYRLPSQEGAGQC